jgi:hypothetical protein
LVLTRVLLYALLTAGVLAGQEPQPLYAPLGVAGIEKIPGEKPGSYSGLRIKFGVITQGGNRSWWVQVRDSAKHDLGLINGHDDHLPKGRAAIFIKVSGDVLQSQLVDGPLSVSGLNLMCGSDGFSGRNEWKTPPVVASDFRGVAPDYSLALKPAAYTVYAGEKAGVTLRINASESFRDHVKLSLTGLPREATVDGILLGVPNGINVFWIEPASYVIPGRYPFRITGQHDDLTREVSGELVILPPRIPLFSAPPVTTATAPLPVASITREALEGTPRFSTETRLYHVNAVLVMQRSGSMRGPRCDAMKQLAARFSEQFVAERDAFGVVAVRSSAIVASPLSRSFKDESQNAAARIRAPDCTAGNSLALGIELAYKQLQAFDDPSGVNIVVLLLATPPSELDADWPVRTEADRRNGYPGGPPGCGNPEAECDLPPSTCFNHVGWRASFVPTLSQSPMMDPYADPPAPLIVDSGCAMGRRSPLFFGRHAFNRDIAFIPETDLSGVAFAGDVPLERFSAGPYAGRIRPDRDKNLANAAVNQVVNAADQIRRDAKLKPLVYAIGLAGGFSALVGALSPSLLSSIAGEKETQGRAYLAATIGDVPKGFELIFKDLLRRAQDQPPVQQRPVALQFGALRKARRATQPDRPGEAKTTPV